MKHVRSYNLRVSGSRYVCAISASVMLLPGIYQTGLSTTVQQNVANESVNAPRLNDELIDFWISQLTSDDFGIRESARTQLLNAGGIAMPQLERHRDATNSELRLSVARLHESIADAIAANQIQSFLDNKATLSGWQVFQKHFGDTPENRRLYAEIFRTEQKLLEQLDSVDVLPVDLLHRLIRGQQSELAHSSQPNIQQLPVLATVVSELFGTTEQALLTSTGQTSLQIQISLAQMVTDPGFQQWIHQPQPMSELVRRSLIEWITAETTSPILISSKISVASLLESGESIPLCLQCLDSRDVPAANRRTAMELIVRFGDTRQIAALEKHIDDALIVYQQAPHSIDSSRTTLNTCQMGDIALASLVLITGQELPRFGFANTKTENGKTLPPVDRLVFPDENTRRKARQQWREFRAENLD